MESHAKAAGHAIHQQLIVFPLGLLATAVVFDILRLITGHTGFAVASYYMRDRGRGSRVWTFLPGPGQHRAGVLRAASLTLAAPGLSEST